MLVLFIAAVDDLFEIHVAANIVMFALHGLAHK